MAEQSPSTVVAEKAPPSCAHDVRNILFLLVFVFPLVIVLAVCAYGFLVWFGQMLFWGPPT